MDYISSVEVIIHPGKSDKSLKSLSCDNSSHLIVSPSGLSQRPTAQRTRPAKLTNMSSSSLVECNDTMEPTTAEIVEYKVNHHQDVVSSGGNVTEEQQEITSSSNQTMGVVSSETNDVEKSKSTSKKKGLLSGIRRSAKGVKTAAVDLRKRGKSKEGKPKKSKEGKEGKNNSSQERVEDTNKELLDPSLEITNVSSNVIHCCESDIDVELVQESATVNKTRVSQNGQNDSSKEINQSNSEGEVVSNHDGLKETRTIKILEKQDLVDIWGEDRINFANSCISPFQPNDPSGSKTESSSNESPSSWCQTSGEQFSVRIGPDYAKHKKKAPSASPLYEVVEILHFTSPKRTTHIADVLPFPTAKAFPDSKVPVIKDPNVPEILVVHFNFPSEHPNVFRPKNDGEGGELILYLKPTQSFLDDVNGSNVGNDDSSAAAASKLFAEWCKHCTESFEWRSRFKCMGIVRDLEKHNISFMKPYNGKPVLIKESGKARRGVSKDGIRYLEMSANVHNWSFIAKKGFVSILPKLKDMNLDMGFTIEAIKDEEMPERMLGCMLLNNINPKNMHTISKEMMQPV